MQIVPQLVLNSLIAGSVYALMALGFNLAYNTTKFFNLAHGVMAAIGGYAVFFFTRSWGLVLVPSVILGVVVAGLAGYLLDKVVYLPLRRGRASNTVLLVASLGAFTALQAVIAIFFTSQFRTLAGGSPIVYDLFGGAITQVQLLIAIGAVAGLLFLSWLLKATTFGKAVRAIGDDEEVARIVGINTNKIIGYVFFISSTLAGLVGILVGFDTGIEPIMGMGLLLKGVIASIVGGVGNVYGGFLGAYLLGLVENFGIWKLSGEWKDAIAFGLLIIFLLFRPKGIIQK